jgi:hypothetical protein
MAINFKSPYVIGGVVIAAVAVVYLASRGGVASSGGSATATSLVAADSVNAQLAALSTSLQATQIGANVQTHIADLQAGSNITGAVLSFGSHANDMLVAQAMQSATINGNVTNHAMTDAATLALLPKLAQIDAANSQALTNITTGAQVDIATKQLSAAEFIAPINADVTKTLANIAGSTAVNITTLQTQAAKDIASTNADAAVNKQLIATGGQVVSSLAGGVFGLL